MAQRTTQKVAPLSTRASVGTVDAKARTVEVVWSTGAKVLRSNWMDGQFYEELDMSPKAIRLDRLNNGAPFLANHDGYDVARTLGVIESARIENGKGIATVRFARAEDDPEADKVFRKVADGIIRSVSVGYRIHRVEKIVTEGEKIPTMRVVDWTPYEISAVALPADAGAGFRSDVPTNDCEITFTRDNQERNQMTEEELKRQAEAEALKRSQEVKAAADAAVLAERERMTSIRSAVRAGKLGDEVAEKMITDGLTVDKARAFVLDEIAKRSEAHVTEPAHVTAVEGGDARDKFVRGATAWLLSRTGDVAERAKKAGAKGFENLELDPGEFRGMSLFDLARESLERSGVKTRGLSRMDLIGKAFTHRSGGYSGTSDFPVLLENVMYKTLLGSYAVTPDTWSRFCKVETVADFRDSNRFRTGSLTSLDSLDENGEYKNKAIPDGEKTSINVATKGNIVAISRKLIINDDMGALSDLMMKLGRAARLSIEEDVYALLAENSGLGPTVGANPFFHSSRGNVNASASAIGVAGIDADRVVMEAQRDINSNEYLNLSPSILLVASGQYAAARVLNNSAYDHDSTKLQKPNAVQGLFRDIVSTPRLSGTRRYLFADPSVAAAIVVAFLEGQGQGPMLESDEGWRVDGTEMKVRMDYKAQVFDPKAALTNAGA